MDLLIKFADTSFHASTDFRSDDRGIVGSLCGLNYRLSDRPNVFRSGFLGSGTTGWDHLYRAVKRMRVVNKAKIPMYIPAKDEVKEFHLSPGSHIVIGATASGKTTTLFRGLFPFLSKVPSSSNQVLIFGEDDIDLPGLISIDQPVELFTEIASVILTQLARFGKYDGNQIDLDNDDHLKALSKEYTPKEFKEIFGILDNPPLPAMIYLDSIRDFVYTSGVQGKGGFNMRIAVETSHLRKALEKLNIHMFMTINPMLAIEQREELTKLATDFDASATSVILQAPRQERESEPQIKIFARGPANPNRATQECLMRNLINKPVTEDEVLSLITNNMVESLEVNPHVIGDDAQDESWSETAYASSIDSNRQMARLYSQNLRSENSATAEQDSFVDLINSMNKDK